MSELRTSVHFTCQRCLQPLKLDRSFNQLSDASIADLSAPILTTTDIDLEAQIASFDHFVPGYHISDSKAGSNGFTLVDPKGETESLNRQITRAAGLFDALSNTSDVDHPLCEECADALIQMLEQQLQFAEEELTDYTVYLRNCEAEEEFDNMDQILRDLENLKKEEASLIEQLKKLQEEEKAMQATLEAEEREKQRLEEEEERYWREYSLHRRDLSLAESESKSLECQFNYTQAQLERLKQTNVFNATFHIWHSGGHFGTINNFRLGRLPTAPVDWSEINAAWGQVTLLMNGLARKIGLEFKRYRLVPYGNHSYIEVLADHKELPLYGSGGFRFLWDTKFDSGLVAFLDCLQQFKEEMEKVNTEFRLPYRMVRGKLEDAALGMSLSIKIQFNSEEQWTKALKFMLTNLKWALAWVSSQFIRDDQVIGELTTAVAGETTQSVTVQT